MLAPKPDTSCWPTSATRPHHADGPLRPPPLHRPVPHAERLRPGLRGEIDPRYPNTIEAFDRVIATDPAFALPHASKAHTLLQGGDTTAARESMATANSLSVVLPASESAAPRSSPCSWRARPRPP